MWLLAPAVVTTHSTLHIVYHDMGVATWQQVDGVLHLACQSRIEVFVAIVLGCEAEGRCRRIYGERYTSLGIGDGEVTGVGMIAVELRTDI